MSKIENNSENINGIVLDSIPIASTPPSDGQMLTYNAASRQWINTDVSSQGGGSSVAGPFSFQVVNLTQTDDWNFFLSCADSSYVLLGGYCTFFNNGSSLPTVSIAKTFQQVTTTPQDILTYVASPTYTTRPGKSSERWVLWFYKDGTLWTVKYKLEIWVTFLPYGAVATDFEKHCVYGTFTAVPSV